jgi:CubicO group peptidase (beta-lactamase class C family)
MTDLPRTRELIERGIADGLHTGAQLFTSIGGRPSGSLALGESRPGVPMTDDTLVLWLSSTKPVAAVAIMQLRERGLCFLDDPVAQHLPEFAQRGKDAVTIRHLLTHTGGFRMVDLGPPGTPTSEIIDRICAAGLERGWVPGEKAGYHPHTSWYILGELVRLIDGREFSAYVRSEIFELLDMHDCWVGMPADRAASYGDRIAPMPNTAKGGGSIHPRSSPTGVLDGEPGAGGYGPMNQLAHLYEMFLGGGERHGHRVLSAESVAMMTSPQRIGMFDESFKRVIDWGLGLIINSRQYSENPPYGYGIHASPRAFGHSGRESSVGMADPEYQLVIALEFNGMPGELRHQKRAEAALAAVYEDLELA